MNTGSTLTETQILFLLKRLKWEPVYEDETIVLAQKRRGGYSETPEITQLEAKLSLMLELLTKPVNLWG